MTTNQKSGTGGDKVVGDPVNAKSRWDVEGEPTNHERQKLQNGRRVWLLSVRARLWLHEFHGNELRDDQKDGEDQKRNGCFPSEARGTIGPIFEDPVGTVGRVSTICRSFQTRQEEEWFVQLIFLGKGEDGTVETDKNWDLYNGRDASSKWVDLIRLVKLGNLLVHDFWVTLVLGLHFLDLRLEGLWRGIELGYTTY